MRCTKEDGYYRLRSLVVQRQYRQFKFGRDLVLAVHKFAREDAKINGITDSAEIHSHSQLPVKGFYAKLVLILSAYTLSIDFDLTGLATNHK